MKCSSVSCKRHKRMLAVSRHKSLVHRSRESRSLSPLRFFSSVTCSMCFLFKHQRRLEGMHFCTHTCYSVCAGLIVTLPRRRDRPRSLCYTVNAVIFHSTFSNHRTRAHLTYTTVLLQAEKQLKATERELKASQAVERAAWEATHKTRMSIIDGESTAWLPR